MTLAYNRRRKRTRYLITQEEMEWRRQQAELILDAMRSFLEDEPWETINAPPTFGRLDTDETPS